MNILTNKSVEQVRATIKGMSRSLAMEVMNANVINFSRGLNGVGSPLKRPKRLSYSYGGGASATGIKQVLKSSGFNIGGAGIDTATLFRHLSKRNWFRTLGNGVSIDPMIGVSGTRPDGIPLVSYIEAYREQCAGGRLTGLSTKAIAGIARRLRSAL